MTSKTSRSSSCNPLSILLRIGEMEDHLAYSKHEKADKPNKRNDHTKKTVRSDTDDLDILTVRDRDSSLVSRVTDIIAWQNRHLNRIYLIVSQNSFLRLKVNRYYLKKGCNGHNSCYLRDFNPKNSLINRNLRLSFSP